MISEGPSGATSEGTSNGNSEGIAAFWAWWPGGQERIRAAVEGRTLDETLVAEITGKVQAIHPKLTWEMGPGGTAKHAFCLSAGGNPELRRVTEKWWRAAPAEASSDGVWELHPSKRGAPNLTDARLQIEGHALALAEMSFALTVDPNRELMNVTSFHPTFAAMPEEMRGMATWVILDRLLGEDTVERWLGGIRTSVEPLEKGGPLAMLAEAVGALAAGATGERFTRLQGETPDGQPMAATINLALKRIDHLACDTHVAVNVALSIPTSDGMPTDDESDALNDIEDELEDMIAGDAVYFGCETMHGRRALHWFVATDHPVRPQLEEWAARHPERDVRLAWRPDPRWTNADRFR